MMAKVIWTKIFLIHHHTFICETLIKSDIFFGNQVKKNEKLYQFCAQRMHYDSENGEYDQTAQIYRLS